MEHHETLEYSSFDATISALDVETSAFGAVTSAIARRSFDATISALDAETSALDAETSPLLGVATSAIARSYRRGLSIDIGDCVVGITPQMCSRVTNHGDMSTFSKPVVARCGDIGDCAELLAISVRSLRRYRRLRSWYNSADV